MVEMVSRLWERYTPYNLGETISHEDVVVTYTYADDRSETGYVLSLTNGMTFTRSVTRDAHRPELVTGVTNVIGSTVRGFVYTYDDLARPISRNADSFGYNTRSEVTEAAIDGHAESHTYDSIGNSVLFAFQSSTNTYVANALNQYSSILCDSASLRELTYNANGDLLTFGPWSFSYDADSRLLTVSSNGVLLVTNAYDCQGRRVRKTTAEAVTTFLYDDWNLIRENVAYTSGEIDAFEYFWGRDLSGTLQGAGGVGGLLYVKRNGTIYIPFADANGNITAYVDVNGTIVAEYVYDAFGRIIVRYGGLADVFRHHFSMKYYDNETGLYYYGYRFYHPGLMRWLNKDVIEENGGDNLYEFCLNSPLVCFDLLGNISVTDIPGIMDANKWKVGASLMRHWFSLDSSVATTPNESLVTMDWVLGYERAKVVYDRIFSEKQYVNQAAQNEIRAMIKRTKKGAEGVFCPLNRPASQVEADYVNTRQVGSVFDPADDLMAALGRFNLRMAVSGYVKGNCAFVTSVGVFVRDSYDFKGDQALGYWNKATNYAGRNFFRGDKVTNENFRNYAKETGKGADYLVFSDVKITTLPKVEKVRIMR